ncbi:hypothetical protein FHR81_004475 [Actinoalloteichus hoggarensis]|uniref:Uncharacterized protein n=1 Tax=Actinoalloteichus hoggarensis TaxID=1470176 RepID=A0A221W3V4_9PSEU|nr:hypothetical protein AHOG_13615 [Actinoalloteichus hoggarensis]MBB5923404.1 hypothetical protein [Actinoalloteichus hoggarensis]
MQKSVRRRAGQNASTVPPRRRSPPEARRPFRRPCPLLRVPSPHDEDGPGDGTRPDQSPIGARRRTTARDRPRPARDAVPHLASGRRAVRGPDAPVARSDRSRHVDDGTRRDRSRTATSRRVPPTPTTGGAHGRTSRPASRPHTPSARHGIGCATRRRRRTVRARAPRPNRSSPGSRSSQGAGRGRPVHERTGSDAVSSVATVGALRRGRRTGRSPQAHPAGTHVGFATHRHAGL